MVLGSVVSVFFKDAIHNAFRSMGKRRLGIMGIFAASALGIASPLCMYGTIPIAASFSKGGMKDDWLAAFMMSSILLNPQLIIYSAALGQTALAVRIISSFLCGSLAGVLVHAFYHDRSFFDFSGFDEPKNRDTDPNLFLRFLKNFGRNIKATGGWFFMGSAAAFMITGSATKITNLGAVKIVLGVRRFVLYIAYVILFSFWAGVIVNLVIRA